MTVDCNHRVSRSRKLALLAGLGIAAVATAAVAQVTAPPEPVVNSTTQLDLPTAPIVFGSSLPSVVKASVIVNGEVITQTDIDQRLALLAIANGQGIDAAQVDALRQQVLRNLIDETLQIQAAKVAEIKIKPEAINRAVERVAQNVSKTPDELVKFLTEKGASVRSMRRQIEGEIAWRQLQSAKIESGVSVGDDEVKAVIDKLQASKGTQEFRVSEIYLSANSANRAEVLANFDRIMQALGEGGAFTAYARQYSESSTASVGGDLGWIRPEMLPESLETAVKQMGPGSVSRPIEVPGGFSVLAVQDVRRVLVDDPRDAILNLKQVTVSFAPGSTPQQRSVIVEQFGKASQSIGGCGGAEKLAADFRGEVVQSAEVKMKELPEKLQELMAPMQVGQATAPFGDLNEGVRVLVMCGRDQVQSQLPSYDQVYAQMNEERVTARARRYLRDLRRDAVIDFR